MKTLLCGILLFLLPFAASAQTTQTPIPNPLGEGTTVSSAIGNIISFILNLGLTIAVIVFLVGGFQYLFSFGSEKKVEGAKNTLWYGVIGLVVILVAKSIGALIQNIVK